MKAHAINGSFLSLFILSIATSLLIISLLAKMFPLVVSKTIYFCQQFIPSALFQIPHTLPNAFILIPAVVVGSGTLSFLIQLIKTQRLVGRLVKKRVNLSRRFENLIESCDLRNRVYLVEDNNLFSFCTGIFSPSVIITTELTQSLEDKELEAVLLHEKSHLKNFDPLKILFGKTISSMFFFLPIFSELYKNMITTNEILADNWTIKTQNGSHFLRSAIRKIIATPQVQLNTVAAITSDSLDIRVHRLVNPAFEYKFHISSVSIIISILFIMLSWFVLQTPVNAFQSDSSHETSYFLCSSDNACRQECNHNVQTSVVSSPEDLFSKSVNLSSSPHQTLKYQSSYK